MQLQYLATRDCSCMYLEVLSKTLGFAFDHKRQKKITSPTLFREPYVRNNTLFKIRNNLNRSGDRQPLGVDNCIRVGRFRKRIFYYSYFASFVRLWSGTFRIGATLSQLGYADLVYFLTTCAPIFSNCEIATSKCIPRIYFQCAYTQRCRILTPYF